MSAFSKKYFQSLSKVYIQQWVLLYLKHIQMNEDKGSTPKLTKATDIF